MRHLLVTAIIALLAGASCSQTKEVAPSIVGTYMAELESAPQPDRIFLQLAYDSSDGWTAYFHRPLQRQYKLEAALQAIKGGFIVTDTSGNQLLEALVSGDSLDQLVLEGMEVKVRRISDFQETFAPQTPRPPFPYRADSITFINPVDSVTLAGTFTTPAGSSPFPAVIFISGSGPQDRDESIGPHRTFAVIADWLAREGIASLRFDDRGMGSSEGSTRQIDLHTYATDVEAALDFVSRQKNVDTNRLGLIGHSEGGAVAPMVSLRDGRADYLVLLAPMNIPGDSIMIVQGERIRNVMSNPDSVNTANKKLQRGIFQIVKEAAAKGWSDIQLQQALEDYLEHLPRTITRPLGLSEMQLAQTVQTMMSPSMRAIVTYDPGPAIQKLSVPVLALYGEKDLQVPPDVCVPAMQADLAESEVPVKFVETVPGVNHLFQEATTGHILEYFGIAETIHIDVLKRITQFIKNQAVQ